MTKTPEPTLASAIHQYDDIADVVIIGFGIAGACGALEARRENADVLVLERASGGGGASALSAHFLHWWRYLCATRCRHRGLAGRDV